MEDKTSGFTLAEAIAYIEFEHGHRVQGIKATSLKAGRRFHVLFAGLSEWKYVDL